MGDDFLRGDSRAEFGDPYAARSQVGRGNMSRANSDRGTINRVTPHGGNTAHNDSDMGIMKSLSSMGSAAKRNLSMLAERFAASGSAAGGNAGTSKEFKPLVDSAGNSNDDEEDGDEVISFEHNKNRNSHTLHDSPTPSSEFQNPLLLNNSNYRSTNNVGISSGGGKKDK